MKGLYYWVCNKLLGLSAINKRKTFSNCEMDLKINEKSR